jgi:hypothetical protein
MKSEMERIWKEPVVVSLGIMVQYFPLVASVPSGLGVTPPHGVESFLRSQQLHS